MTEPAPEERVTRSQHAADLPVETPVDPATQPPPETDDEA